MNINADISDEEEEKLKSYLKNESNYRELKDNLGYVCRRTRARILRYKRYTTDKDKYNFYRVQILLYVPWRDEQTEVECGRNQEKIADRFLEQNVIDAIKKNKARFEISDCDNIEMLQDEIEQAIFKHNNDEQEREAAKRNAVEKFLRKNHPNKEIDPDDSINDFVTGSQLDVEKLEEIYGYAAVQEDIFEINAAKSENNMPIATPRRMNELDYNRLMCGLNDKQQIYMMNFVRLIKAKEPFYHFIRGGAGTGKSFLIKAIFQTLVRLVEKNKPKDFINHDKKSKKNSDEASSTLNDDTPLYCLIAAFTAKAAFNVGGDTFVRCFGLQTMQDKSKKGSERMAEDTRNKMLQKYKNVKLIIIEEVSMISSTFMQKANEKIQLIFNNHEKPFAGIPVICVGDFNQLPPMMGQFIFRPTSDNCYHQFADNPLWNPHFKLYELTEIMRVNPAEIEFAKALNVLGEHGTLGLNSQQIAMFNSRIRNVDYFDDYEKDAIFIYYLNASVHERNERIINRHPNQLFECPAVDYAEGNDKDSAAAREELENLHTNPETIKKVYEACKLPEKLKFKVGIKYMITKNINTSDGIVNGATCILKYAEPHNRLVDDNRVPAVRKVYLDFENNYIGQTLRARAKQNDKYKYDYNIDKTWTPIDFYKHMIKHVSFTFANFKIYRIQYPLEPAEALTIHKSQGQTFGKVAVCIHMDQKMDRAKLYVAISRVTSLNGLFLFGSESIIPTTERNLTMEERQKKIKERTNNCKIAEEMKRLRKKSQYTNRFDFMARDYMSPVHRKSKSLLTIMYQNIQTISELKKNVIQRDMAFRNADLIHFVSTGMKPNHRENIKLDQYDILLETTCQKMPSHQSGTLTYVWRQKQNDWGLVRFWSLVYTNADRHTHIYEHDRDNKDVEISIFSCEPDPQNSSYTLYVCFVYKHPRANLKKLIEKIQLGLEIGHYDNNRYPKGLIIIGDFNMDFNKKENNQAFIAFKNTFQVEPLITNEATNDQGNQIDWIFATNVGDLIYTAKTYESFQSDHKPLFLKLKFLKALDDDDSDD